MLGSLRDPFDGMGRQTMPSNGRTVTRVELSAAIYRSKRGLTRKASDALVDLVLKETTDTLARGESVKLSSFGTFTVRKKEARTGRNPKTGVETPIAPRQVVVFKASAIMKQRIQGSGQALRRNETNSASVQTIEAEPAE
jgi:integration host factor subunit alpha